MLLCLSQVSWSLSCTYIMYMHSNGANMYVHVCMYMYMYTNKSLYCVHVHVCTIVHCIPIIGVPTLRRVQIARQLHRNTATFHSCRFVLRSDH